MENRLRGLRPQPDERWSVIVSWLVLALVVLILLHHGLAQVVTPPKVASGNQNSSHVRSKISIYDLGELRISFKNLEPML
jgi:hypothetical protein